MPKIEKILVNNNECFLINQYKILGIDIFKFVKTNGEIVFALKKKDKFSEIKNEILLKQIRKKFIYNIPTDISENNNEE